MNANDNTSNPAPDRPSVADGNVENLIRKAYRPEAPGADFAQRARQRLLEAAAANPSTATHEEPAMPARTLRLVRGPFPMFGPAGAIAAVLLVALGLFMVLRRNTTLESNPARPDPGLSQTSSGGSDTAPVRLAISEGRLTPTPRQPMPATRPAGAGESIQTKKGERRRVTLADGSVLYVNENTAVKVEGPRRVTLSAGEVFVEVSPREKGSANDPTFVVKTPGREVSALGTKFNVRTGDKGTGVLVTQGKVKVSGLNEPVAAGQQALPERESSTSGPVAPAPRASHMLDWTRDLVAASETPLVPDSPHEGGALVVI